MNSLESWRYEIEISRNPYEVSDLVQEGLKPDAVHMLTSPSHWFVRAAQPYMLTAPWLGARHGYLGVNGRARSRPEAMIASPLVKESVRSRPGHQGAIQPRRRGETFTVIDQVMAHIG